MKPSATFPTPYGVSVPVCEHPSIKGEFMFNLDAVAVCGGIYDAKERGRFVTDMTTAGRIDPIGWPNMAAAGSSPLVCQNPAARPIPKFRAATTSRSQSNIGSPL